MLPLLLLFQKVSLSSTVVFGTYLSIDEIMIRFSGQSSQTHVIKNKPVKEGYRWFVLIDSITSYILNFTPDGRTVGKDKNVTDEIDDKGGGKIIAMINFLVKPLL